ncbi:ABC transporter substrate-binding protein [Pikeienuella piscinae]|uniref:ABC transporter substrate-binding protein n=1 Tax=Pikeienuella piscinae TaxID=2748098 RepID=A0A7L5BWF4_9RHOB|nr:ABC transporter substrate-binding protein [Pikeienuella piscinae]QIE56740.1 ABC transporter substrate-binding protein [Pikeienuella piscinae]
MRIAGKLLTTVGAVGMSLAIAANGVAAQDDKITVRSIPIGNLKVLDPIWTTAYITRNHAYMVWDTLFATDENGEIQPQMVDTWDASEDGLTWTFTLRDGLLWHDGAPVTAEDCVASLKRWGARDGMGRTLLDFTDSIEAVDDKTFKMVLNEPVGFVLDALGKIDSNVPFMMPKRIAETDPNEQIEEIIGSGPFRFVADEWVPGSQVVYEKFEEYVPRDEPPSLAAGGKVVHIDRVESVYMPDAGVAMAALAGGEVDLNESPPTELLPMLEGNPDVVLAPNDPLGYQLFLVINHLHPPFDNKAARQALQWGNRQSDYMATIVGDPDRWQECGAMYGCGTGSESHAGEEPVLGFDLDKAKALLEEAGYDGSPVVLMDPADNSTLHPAALVGAQSLRRMGMEVEVQAMDWSTLTQRRASKDAISDGGWNVFITNSTIAGISNPLIHSFAKNCEKAWYGWPCEPKAAELVREWALETDSAKRKALTDQIQALNYENVTYIPLGQYRPVVAYRSNITDVIPSPSLFYWGLKKTAD